MTRLCIAGDTPHLVKSCVSGTHLVLFLTWYKQIGPVLWAATQASCCSGNSSSLLLCVSGNSWFMDYRLIRLLWLWFMLCLNRIWYCFGARTIWLTNCRTRLRFMVQVIHLTYRIDNLNAQHCLVSLVLRRYELFGPLMIAWCSLSL